MNTPRPTVAEQLAAEGLTMRDVGLASERKATRKARVKREPRQAVTGWQWGTFGDKGHLWAQGRKADSTGWVTRCSRIQKWTEPNGEHGVECLECLQEEG